MLRAVLLLLAFFSLEACSGRDCCCQRSPECAPAACMSPAPPPAAAVQDPRTDELREAAEAGLSQWLYDEVYAANRALQECLLASAHEKDPLEAKRSHDLCIARFKERLKAAEANVVRARETSTEVRESLPGAAPLPK